MSSSKARLLGVGFGAYGSGFGRVLRNLYPLLEARWEIEHLDFAPRGMATAQATWIIHQTRRPGPTLGHHEFAALIAARRPQLVLFIGDLWQVPPYLDALSQLSPRPAMVAYCPVDAPLPAYIDRCAVTTLTRLGMLLIPTNYGATQVTESLKRLGIGASSLRLGVIPHGVDSECFYPFAEEGERSGRQLARAELFPGRHDLEDAFIVLNANRNQPRKRFQLTLEGFARFASDKPPNVRLLLHTGIIERGINLMAKAYELGIEERILRIVESKYHPVVTDAILNTIYNACDVGVNTSSGEGWGLVAFEHAATGAAQILPDNSASAELWRGAATLLNDNPDVMPSALAAALEDLYRDGDFRQAQGKAAQANTTRSEWRWCQVADRFEEVFEQVMKSVIS